MQTGSFFAEFVTSPEYAKWLAARKAREDEPVEAKPAPTEGATQE
ncbi:MAG: hypothetical protein ACYTKD_19275 [Planctomycetota bacterium]|jgi:hypothetical protein